MQYWGITLSHLHSSSLRACTAIRHPPYWICTYHILPLELRFPGRLCVWNIRVTPALRGKFSRPATGSDRVRVHCACSYDWPRLNRRRKVEWIDRAPIGRTSLSYILIVFSYIDGFLGFGEIWQLETHRNPLLTKWLQFAFVFLKSNFIFSEKRSKVFYFEGPPETRGGSSCARCLFRLE